MAAELKSIRMYSRTFDLLANETELPADLDPDFLQFLQNCDDFESIKYAVINDAEIAYIDSVNGDVIGTGELAGLLPELAEYYKTF